MLKNISPTDLVDVIRQVHAGKKRIPTEIATHLAEHLSDEALTLTDREIEVLKHIVGGNRNRDIAEHLLISEETVKVHIKHIIEKLGASDRTQAVAIAVRRGIIQLMMADTISVARKHPGVAESNRARVILRS